jgi:hypothetical protein
MHKFVVDRRTQAIIRRRGRRALGRCTNVLGAGISSFRKLYVRGKNPNADVLYKWAEKGNFVWLVTEDILDEYKEVLKRLRVRSTLIGAVINLIRASRIGERSRILWPCGVVCVRPIRPVSQGSRHACSCLSLHYETLRVT